MAQHLFPNFLSDPREYAQAEAFWKQTWDELKRLAGQPHEWITPWLQTVYADGTPFQDGDPIFSAWAPARLFGVRIIQHMPTTDEMELAFWIDVVGDEWTGQVRTLVISCALSDQAAYFALDLILSWMLFGKVSVSQEEVGPPRVSPPQKTHSLRRPATTARHEPVMHPDRVPA
jgi:hypothetical protein